MATTVNNIYRNQYKKALRLRGAFEQYWLKYGIQTDGDSIKSVMGTIFNLLQDDLKITQEDSDYNQVLYDRVEFKDLLNLIQQVLGKYLELSKSDIYSTTEPKIRNLKESIIHEINDFLSKSNKDNEKISQISNRIEDEVQKFIDRIKINKNENTSNKSDTKTDEIDGLSDSLIQKVKSFFEKDKHNYLPNKNRKINISSSKGSFSQKIPVKKEDKQYNNHSGANGIDKNAISEKISKSFEKSPIGFNNLKKITKSVFNNRINKIKNFSGSIPGNSIDVMQTAQNMATSMFLEINSIDEKNSEKRNKQIKGETKKVKSRIARFGSSIMKFMLFPLKILAKLFSPVGKVLKGIINVIFHPIQSVKKLFSSNTWFTKLFVMALSNPGSAAFLGVIIGGIAGYIYKSIKGLVDKYSDPFFDVIETVSGFALELYDLVLDFFDRIKDFVRFSMFVLHPIPEAGLFQSFLVNLSRWNGSGLDVKSANTIVKSFKLMGLLVSSVKSLNSKVNSFSPLIHGALSGAGVLGIIPTLAVSGGKFFNELFDPMPNSSPKLRGQYTNGINERIEDSPDYILEQTYEKLLVDFSNIGDTKTRHDAFIHSRGVLDTIKNDLYEIKSCRIQLDQLQEADLPPTKDLIDSVINGNSILGKEYCNNLLRQQLRGSGGDLSRLSYYDQIQILNGILDKRLDSCRHFINYFNSGRRAEDKAGRLQDFHEGRRSFENGSFVQPKIEIEDQSTQQETQDGGQEKVYGLPPIYEEGGQAVQRPEGQFNGNGGNANQPTGGPSIGTNSGKQPQEGVLPRPGSPSIQENPHGSKITAKDIELKIGSIVLLNDLGVGGRHTFKQGEIIQGFDDFQVQALKGNKPENPTGEVELQWTLIALEEAIKENQKLQDDLRKKLLDRLEEARRMCDMYIIKVGNQGSGDLGGGG